MYQFLHFHNILLGFSTVFDTHIFISALHPQTRIGRFPPFELPTLEFLVLPIFLIWNYS